MGKRGEPMLMSSRRCVCGHAKNLHDNGGVGACTEHVEHRVTLCNCKNYTRATGLMLTLVHPSRVQPNSDEHRG